MALNVNEQALMDLAERTNAPGYQIDPFLAASALPQNQAPVVREFRGEAADAERLIDQGAADLARARGVDTNMVTGQPSQDPIREPANLNRMNNLLPNSSYAQSLFSGIDDKMSLIMQEQDPTKKEAALAALKGSVAESTANLLKETRKIAERDSGLTDLEGQLKMSEQQDRSDPRWKEFMSDSPITQKIRAEYFRSQEVAGKLTQRMLEENPYIASMSSKLKGFVGSQENLIRASLSSDEKKREILADIAGSFGPDTLKAVSYLVPDVNMDPMKAAEVKRQMLLGKDPSKKQYAFLFDPSFNMENILDVALQGNKAAQELALKIQIEKTGQPKEQARESFRMLNTLASSEETFMKALSDRSKQGDVIAKETLSKYTQSKTMESSKYGEERRAAMRIDEAQRIVTDMNTKAYKGNVESWTPTEQGLTLKAIPEVAAIIEKHKVLKPGKPVSLDFIVEDYIKEAPKDMKAARLDQVKAILSGSLEQQNKSLFGRVDKKPMIDSLTVKAVQGRHAFISGMRDTAEAYGKDYNKGSNFIGGTLGSAYDAIFSGAEE